MKLLSVNLGQKRAIPYRGKQVMTGIFKEPVPGNVKVGPLGLEGDVQADPKVHGGIHKAVYAYPFEHYEFWARELGRNDFAYGQFGENLTLTGATEDDTNIGDIFRIGTVLLEVSQPRVPCFKLAHRMSAPGFSKKFTHSGHTGFYLRVLAEGEISAGYPIERIKTDPHGVTVREVMRVMHVDREDYAVIKKAITVPSLTPSWREELEERLRTKA